MPDLDPLAIENLLQEAALRRGVTVDAYRYLVQATAGVARVSFATALQVMTAFEKMAPGDRKALFEQLDVIEQQAARHGVSVSSFVRIMFGGGREPPPS